MTASVMWLYEASRSQNRYFLSPARSSLSVVLHFSLSGGCSNSSTSVRQHPYAGRAIKGYITSWA